ncbi:DMT family transporter [Streptomyces sp. JB150]|uniref:DMT family transporter n=1 Tax=Streptomyces sp. JB150 TaxID=2714844 RepID=UPI0014087394|nr:DMT family transporter [Streptomyces sp. JB150]QIJ65935.1 hypothetical protein G7Z13_30940 [Streptomyces sp. JB150]
MSALALSVLLSLVSAVAYAGGAIVQERVAVSSPDGRQYAPLRRPIWWAAVALNGLGGLLHVVALAYGPLSLVQPLGALTIVFALPMAALFVRRKAGAAAWRGALMATVGLAGLLSLVGAADTQSLRGPQQITVFLVTAGAVTALMIAGRAAHRHPAVRALLLATASGVAFGMSSVFTKTVAADWTGGVSAVDLPPLAAIGVLATAGLMLSQASYRGAGLAAPLATLTVANPVVAAAVGITMFGESFRYGTTGTVLALGCAVVAAGGLILLTTERIARDETRTRPEPAQPGLPAPAAGSGVTVPVPVTVPARAGSGTAVLAPVPSAKAVPVSASSGAALAMAAGPSRAAAAVTAGLPRTAVAVADGPPRTAVAVADGPPRTAVAVADGPPRAAVAVPAAPAAGPVGPDPVTARGAVPASGRTAAVPAARRREPVPVTAAPSARATPSTQFAQSTPSVPSAPEAGPDGAYESRAPSGAVPLRRTPYRNLLCGVSYVPLPALADRHRTRLTS